MLVRRKSPILLAIIFRKLRGESMLVSGYSYLEPKRGEPKAYLNIF